MQQNSFLNRIKLIFLTTFLVCVQAMAQQSQPNIIHILVDDLGYADLSVHGQTEFSTPNIDSIFNGGARFTDSYATNSVCAPSRAGLLTGRMGSKFGFESNLPHKYASKPGSRIGLDPEQSTMADVLKTAGYRTMAIGKWHLGDNDELFHPNVRGFDDFYGLTGGSRTYFQLTEFDHYKSLQYNGAYIVEDANMYVTDHLTDAAIDLIDDQTVQNPESPFFIYMSYTAPHLPAEAKPEIYAALSHITDDTRRHYAGLIINLDENIGRLLAHLDSLGIADNTMVVFMSDNGGKHHADNGVLRGTKGTMWEGGVRVPMAVKWEGVIPAGQVFSSDTVISSLDWMPTFAAISGADQLQTINTDGVNLMPLLTSQTPMGARELYWRRGTTNHTAIRSADYKYYLDRNAPMEYLFNLVVDANEWNTNNIITNEPAVAEQLVAKHAAWEASIPYPAWNSSGELFAITTYQVTVNATETLNKTLTIASSQTALTWSILSGQPAWLTLDSVTGVISGTPAEADVGEYIMQVQVTDGIETTSYALPLTVTASTTIDYSAVGDAHVRAGAYADNNYGATTVLKVRNKDLANDYDSYFSFDIGTGTVQSATLTLVPTVISGTRDFQVQLLADSDDALFDENTITWNSKLFGTGVSVAVSGPYIVGEAIEIDVTSIMTQAEQQNNVATFCLTPGNYSTSNLGFASKEHATLGYRPVLSVTYQ